MLFVQLRDVVQTAKARAYARPSSLTQTRAAHESKNRPVSPIAD